MVEKFYPDLFVEKLEDIDFERLQTNNIKGLILDIDNTLVPHDQPEADERAVTWLEAAKEKGMKMCLVSNNTETRVIKFNEKLKLPAIHKAIKPTRKPFIKALALMDLNPGEAAVVGDQIFTDVYGGNRMNLFTILVSPVGPKESFFIKLKRMAEIKVMKDYKKMKPEQRKKRAVWKKAVGSKFKIKRGSNE